MLVCENPYSWQLLLDYKLLACEDVVFLFESKFAADTAIMTNYDHLHKVINCMQVGKKIVLYKLNSAHECLYDMLNQRYHGNSPENRFCRVAVEDQTRDCIVAKEFKCIVIVFKEDTDNSVTTTMANFVCKVCLFLLLLFSKIKPYCRFFFQRRKKHFLDALKDNTFHMLDHCRYPNLKKKNILKHKLCRCYGLSSEKELPELFCGFVNDTISSAIVYILLQRKPQLQSDVKQDESEQLLELFYPLRYPAKIVSLAMDQKFDNTNQSFDTFEQVLNTTKHNSDKEMLLILTCDLEHSSFQRKWNSKRTNDYMKVSHFEKDVTDFFESSRKNRLILQYQHKGNDLTQFFQIKCILESAYSLCIAANPITRNLPTKNLLFLLFIMLWDKRIHFLSFFHSLHVLFIFAKTIEDITNILLWKSFE
ncbi:hypothetical protein RFI_25443 [Reticulomyxa filosa]|uniref:Uncharacterized protein n=1 Tax=Reticulomyxa filosa TaxID=46433 RepID=X6MEV7_RETFI|nr:hypothetical protein RFI_25443 [Reticulomyxa filosa]|eukprot:ETO11932.1 hypothetical protein RFI_25443 [Reticulomyxa filosa]